MLSASGRPGGELPWNQRRKHFREREEVRNANVPKVNEVAWHDSTVR